VPDDGAGRPSGAPRVRGREATTEPGSLEFLRPREHGRTAPPWCWNGTRITARHARCGFETNRVISSYLASRGLTLPDSIASDLIRFHSTLQFNGTLVPGMRPSAAANAARPRQARFDRSLHSRRSRSPRGPNFRRSQQRARFVRRAGIAAVPNAETVGKSRFVLGGSVESGR
jgi:hypothetical protein